MRLTRFLQKLSNESVRIELKNGTKISGTISSVDVAMNIHIRNAKMAVTGRGLISIEAMTIRGNTLRMIELPDSLPLDNLLVEEKTKQQPPRNPPGMGKNSRGGRQVRGRGRGGGRRG